MMGISIFALACFLITQDPSTIAGDINRPSETYVFGDGEYRLGAGDVIEVFVWKEPELTITVAVRPDGKISLPLIDEFEAQNKTVAQLQKEISKNLRRYVAEPRVTVILKEVNAPRITVLGNVRKPDVYKIRSKVSVLEAIALAGGFNDYANRNKVIVIRATLTGAQSFRLNIKKILQNPGAGIFYLNENDTVYVE